MYKRQVPVLPFKVTDKVTVATVVRLEAVVPLEGAVVNPVEEMCIRDSGYIVAMSRQRIFFSAILRLGNRCYIEPV